MLKPNEVKKEKVERLAFSLQETADALGLSYVTIWRLVKRGKLRSVPGLRHHVIPLREIERFLASVGREDLID